MSTSTRPRLTKHQKQVVEAIGRFESARAGVVRMWGLTVEYDADDIPPELELACGLAEAGDAAESKALLDLIRNRMPVVYRGVMYREWPGRPGAVERVQVSEIPSPTE